MLRWVPAYWGKHPTKSLLPVRAASHLGLASFSPISSHGSGLKYNESDFDILFHSCDDICFAKRIHALLVVLGRAQSIFVSTRLLNLYARLGHVSYGVDIFNNMPRKDLYTCNSMIAAYVHIGCFHDALSCFNQLLLGFRVEPDFYTFPPVLKACTNLVEGAQIHCRVSKLGYQSDIFVAASLVHAYCRFGVMDVACKLFDEMPVRDSACWNAVICGFCQNGNPSEALDVLDKMRSEGMKMDTVTISSALPLCAQLEMPSTGMLIHLYVIKHGLESNLYVSNALIHMYGRFGRMGDLKTVFDQMVVRDEVSWNSMIGAYEQNNDPIAALKCYNVMRKSGFDPDTLTLMSLTSSLAQARDHRNGRSIHGFVARRNWLVKDTTLGNSVMDMYMKLGDVESAHKVFEQLLFKDVVAWNTLIAGYTQNGLASEAINVFRTMQGHEEMKPNEATWVGILPAYSYLGALREGMKIHGWLLKTCLYLDTFVVTCLIDMYGKCGELDNAVSLFHQMQPWCSCSSWNAIIACHGVHGHGEAALELFTQMLDHGVKPNDVTFVSLLSACSHSGLIDQGRCYFNMMQEDYGIKPGLKHYGCMVDLLGRGGYVEKALNFIRNMPLQPDASVWGAFLGACRIHGHVELAEMAKSRSLEASFGDLNYNVLLANIYAKVGKWDDVYSLRSSARDGGLKKTPGWSSVEVGGRVHVFYTGSRSHPDCGEIYRELRVLGSKMKNLGYVPDYGFVLQDVEDDEKEQILMGHSERLAIAFGIIRTAPGTSLRIFKNLRVCGDCHNATKYLSRVAEREILVRDYNRFHLFKDGFCSCGDYW